MHAASLHHVLALGGYWLVDSTRWHAGDTGAAEECSLQLYPKTESQQQHTARMTLFTSLSTIRDVCHLYTIPANRKALSAYCRHPLSRYPPQCVHPSLAVGLQGAGGGGLYEGDAHVLSLKSSNFPSSKDQSVYLVEFYAPW